MSPPEALSSPGRVRVLFDATRLVSRGNATPTGIDRVDLAYLTALARAPDFDLRLVLFDVFGPRLLPPRYSQALMESTQRRWQLGPPSLLSETSIKHLVEWLRAPAGEIFVQSQDLLADPAPVDHPENTAASWRRLPRRLLTKPTVYLNTSHGRLYRKSISRWLRATGMPSVFFVHDLIPVDFPQFNRRAEPARHAARLRTISRCAEQVLVNSRATAEALSTYLEGQKLRCPSIKIASLGIEKNFSNRVIEPLADIAQPYFVILGTIEPRKNHQLLLDIWCRWIKSGRADIPRLLILGRRGWRNESVFRLLNNLPEPGKYIAECGNIGDAHVTAILRQARALLCPSFAEGFSLPVVEALALGTPVIASDIPAHAEVDQGCSERVNPKAHNQWAAMILDYAEPESKRRLAQIERIRRFSAPAWTVHFEQVLPCLQQCARQT